MNDFDPIFLLCRTSCHLVFEPSSLEFILDLILNNHDYSIGPLAEQPSELEDIREFDGLVLVEIV